MKVQERCLLQKGMQRKIIYGVAGSQKHMFSNELFPKSDFESIRIV